MRSSWTLGGPYIHCLASLSEKGEGDWTHRETQRRRLREGRRSEGCRHKPADAQGHQKLGEARKDSPWSSLEGVCPC